MSNKTNKKKLKMKEIIKQMNPLIVDGIKNDWMGFELTEENYPTYHHIIKQSTLKGENIEDDITLENGALLGDLSHASLHAIENININIYNDWNDVFKSIIKEGKVTDDIYNKILDLQKESMELFNSNSRN